MAEQPKTKRNTRARPRTGGKNSTAPKKTGPKPMVPTPEMREQVAALHGYGLPEEKIARLIINPKTGKPITAKTLREHFAKDLEDGRSKAWAQSLKTGFNLANGTTEVRLEHKDGRIEIIREAVKPNPTFLIWWQKTQMGMMEEEKRQRIEIAKKLAELAGAVEEGADPHQIGRDIRRFIMELDKATDAA